MLIFREKYKNGQNNNSKQNYHGGPKSFCDFPQFSFGPLKKFCLTAVFCFTLYKSQACKKQGCCVLFGTQFKGYHILMTLDLWDLGV
jgi:hypothetical protein